MRTMRVSFRRPVAGLSGLGLAFGLALALATPCEARRTIRNAFFAFYPSAVGSKLDNLPTKPDHCAVCHYDANGAGTKNPYGNLLKANYDVAKDWAIAINMADAAVNPGQPGHDPDGDGYSTRTELVGTGFSNTPTFPGLNNTNVNSVVNATISEILPNVTPTIVVDKTPPTVLVNFPNGGPTQSLIANTSYNVTWTASDASGIVAIHIYLSLDGGLHYTPVVYGLENTGTYAWAPANRPTADALIKVVAVDGALNYGHDTGNSAFAIVSPEGGKVQTTLRDFDMPGTQPFEGGRDAAPPEDCAQCHGNYDPAVEPYANWQGSMMAHASRDPLFEANMVIANQDAPDSGDLCLRCHDSSGWMQGRSVPTDGSAILEKDKIGVSCDLCHRMVDPNFIENLSPARDQQVLAGLSSPATQYGNGMVVLDPESIMRGPFQDATAPHPFVKSPFHKSSAFCGTCHDVSNPAFTRNPGGIYEPNAMDTPVGQVYAHSAGPVERTYSEWLNSEYATTGVWQPEFAGNKADGIVSTCQDCHMRDVNAKGCNITVPESPTRPDMPLHDMTGGSTWIPQIIAAKYPAKVNAAAITAGIARARTMLRNAADLAVEVKSGKLVARVTNQTGHKLPTGYPEGRRIWVNVKFYDAAEQLISESGAYDPATGELSHDPEAKIYEVHPGIGENIAGPPPGVGLPAGPSLHFVLNNKIYEDNRIPPRGFTNAAFASFGGSPVGHAYADGQHWDETAYTIPAITRRAEVRLYYQSTSKEFVEFLRDENVTDDKGTVIYNLWNENGKCPPELMVQEAWTLNADGDDDDDGMPNATEQLHGMNPFDAADALEDADDDGMPNLVETALASDPTDAASMNPPAAHWIVDNATRRFSIQYIRLKNNPAADILAEVSEDLVTWNSGPTHTAVHQVTDNPDGTETVIEGMIPPVSGTTPWFMRLKILPK